MPEDKGPLKSAVELAMERLRKKDEESGVTSRALSDADKTAIAEIRNFYEAKLAQEDVLHQSQLRSVREPAERDVVAAPGGGAGGAGRRRRAVPPRGGAPDLRARCEDREGPPR